ncbi:hypothetical protein DFQ28_001905, partial [Apophysomyces sp. BC1034]
DIAELKAQLADLTAQMASATRQGNMEIKLNLHAAVKELCEDIEELECSEKVYQNEEKKDSASIACAPHNLPLFQWTNHIWSTTAMIYPTIFKCLTNFKNVICANGQDINKVWHLYLLILLSGKQCF